MEATSTLFTRAFRGFVRRKGIAPDCPVFVMPPCDERGGSESMFGFRAMLCAPAGFVHEPDGEAYEPPQQQPSGGGLPDCGEKG